MESTLLKRALRDAHPLVVYLSSYFGVPSEAVYSKNQKKELCWVRYIVWDQLRESYTLEVLGRVFSRNHATVLNGIAQLDSVRQAYPMADEAYKQAVLFVAPDEHGLRLVVDKEMDLHIDLSFFPSLTFKSEGVTYSNITQDEFKKLLKQVRNG